MVKCVFNNITEQKADERTLVLIKPDAVSRKLAGTIMVRLENKEDGLRIIECKRVPEPAREMIELHYAKDDAWLEKTGNRLRLQYLRRREEGDEITEEDKELLEKTNIELGKVVLSRIVDYMTSGEMIAVVVEGAGAIEKVRAMAGATEPKTADPWTIRGEFGNGDSYEESNMQKRSIYNLIHASDDQEDAKREIELWFGVDVAEGREVGNEFKRFVRNN